MIPIHPVTSFRTLALSVRTIALATFGGCAVLIAGCTAADDMAATPDSAGAADVREWTVAAEPELEIGVLEGDPGYQMHRLVSAVVLTDGSIAALNAGTHELRVYDANGVLVSRSGRRGGGPGEFLNPLRVYLLGDTLAVFDEGADRLSLHRLDGEFIAARALTRSIGGVQWDEWLHDMSWIDGPPLGRGRTEVMRAVERLPAPDTSEGYRYVRVTPSGHLWVRQPAAVDAPTRMWHVHDLTGGQIARVQVPASLDVYDTGPDYLVGRGRDSLGIEYLRRHRLDTRGTALARHAFAHDTPTVHTAADTAAVIAVLEHLRSLAAMQEVYYSQPENGYRYADDHRKLTGYDAADDVIVRIVRGHTRGWTAVAMHRATGVMCGIAVGDATPVGWIPGVPMCR